MFWRKYRSDWLKSGRKVFVQQVIGQLLAIDATRLHVGPIEVVDGTPVIDIKPVVSSSDH